MLQTGSYEWSRYKAGDDETRGGDKSVCQDTAHALCTGEGGQWEEDSEGMFSLKAETSLRGQRER